MLCNSIKKRSGSSAWGVRAERWSLFRFVDSRPTNYYFPINAQAFHGRRSECLFVVFASFRHLTTRKFSSDFSRLALDLSAPCFECNVSHFSSQFFKNSGEHFQFFRQLLSSVASGREEKTWKSKMLSLFGLFSLINSLSKVNFYCFSFSFV